MKTKEELNTIKEEVEALNEKCRELTEEELKEVNGGVTGEDEEPLEWNLWDPNKSSGRARIPQEFL